MKAVIIVLIALAAVVNAFNALPFGLDGTEYFFSSDSNSLSKSSQITIRGTNIGIPLEAGYNTSFTVSPGTRLTGELECRDDKTQSILPSSTVSLEEGLYKIRVTGTRGVTAKDTISFTCGSLSVASSIYDKNNDPQTISVSSVKGASTHSSKVFPKPPPMAISATPSLATFQYGVGKSGYMEFKFPKSLYPLNVSTKHHYFMIDFPHAVKVFNPSGERDQQVCYDPTNSERFYMASYFMAEGHIIQQLRIDVFLGTTVETGEEFIIRVPGIISPPWAVLPTKMITIKVFNNVDQHVATEHLPIIVGPTKH